ncbi:hypothetical protein [Vulgatibacter sp.]|uniref:hypothetical protein n=1 Tax=Vulgatibacter sp. TaxID=1971226 RepID=UPI00356AA667
MHLVELILQGVAGHPPQGRLQLGQGHVVVQGGAPLLPILRSLLFYDGSPDDGTAQLAAAPGAKVGLVLRGRDGGIFRLVRELRGGCTLQRLDVAERRFVAVEAGPGEIGPFLRAQVGVPSRQIFEELFTFDPALLRAAAVPAPGAPPLPELALPEPAPAAPAADPAELRGGIARLEQELEATRRVDELQRQLDESLHRQAGLQRDRDLVRAAEGRVSGLRGALQRYEVLGDLPDDVAPLVAAYRAADADRAAALQRIEADRAAVEGRAPPEAPAPVWKDRRFLGACGLGFASLSVALFTPLRIVALLDVPAFGVAAALAVKWVGELQALDSASKLGVLFTERERRVEAQWEAATAPLRAALQRAGLQLPDELVELVRARAEARAQVAAAEAELEAAREAHGGSAALLEELHRQSTAIEEQLAGLAASAYRPRTMVEAELATLRAQLEGRAPDSGGGTLLGAAVPLAARALTPVAPAPRSRTPLPGVLQAGPSADPCARAIDHAAELLAADRHELGGRMAQRVGQYLAAFTDRRLGEVALSSTAGMRCGGIPFAELPAADRGVAFLSLQLALIEQVAARQPVPVIYDDPFHFLDEAKQELLGRMLQGLGKRAQVIHRTEAPPFLAHADTVAAFR